MTSVNKNMTSFNKFVRLQRDALTARGKSSSDVMVNLFKDYLAAPDSQAKENLLQRKPKLARTQPDDNGRK